MSDELRANSQQLITFGLSLVTRHCFYYSCGIAGDDRAGGNVFSYYRARADYRALAYLDAAEDGRVRADGCAAADDCRFELPVRFGLRRAVFARGAGTAVVDEHDAVADEDFVLDADALADEGVARNLAARAYARALLDFDEGADARLVADAAAVEVDEAVDSNVAAQDNVRSDAAKLSRHQTAPGRSPAPATPAPSGAVSSSE